jgi:hypothetical protein
MGLLPCQEAQSQMKLGRGLIDRLESPQENPRLP